MGLVLGPWVDDGIGKGMARAGRPGILASEAARPPVPSPPPAFSAENEVPDEQGPEYNFGSEVKRSSHLQYIRDQNYIGNLQ